MNTLLINFVAYYATQVRAALVDLPQDAIEDLTDGLEADLMDAMQETRGDQPTQDLTLNDLINRFGQPGDYALELRTAAGFSPSAPGDEQGSRRTFRRRIATWAGVRAREFQRTITSAKWWAPFRDFMVPLRPVWWVLRAVVLYVMVLGFSGAHTNFPLPETFGALIGLLILMGLSAKAGLRTVAGEQRRSEPKAVKLLNIILVIAVLPATISVITAENARGSDDYGHGYSDGMQQVLSEYGLDGVYSDGGGGGAVMVDGAPVTNLFAYDAQGNPIPQAQIVNQDGLPLSLSPGVASFNQQTGEVRIRLSATDDYGRKLNNVYPAQTWVLNSSSKYCTPRDRELWTEIKDLNYYPEGNEIFSFADGQPLATVAGVDTAEGYFDGGATLVLTSERFTDDETCVMGIKVPEDLTASLVFPAERIAPLGGAAGGEEAEGDNPDAHESEPAEDTDAAANEGDGGAKTDKGTENSGENSDPTKDDSAPKSKEK